MPVTTPTKHKHWNEVVALILFAVGLLILLGLLSYSATDPCFSVSSAGDEIKNTIGIIGSYLSDALLKLFGITAYLFPIFLIAYAALLVLSPEAAHPNLKKAGGAVLFISLTAFFGLQGETIRLFNEDVPSGGMLGGLIALVLLKGVSSTGAYIITLTAITASLILLTPFSLLKFLAWARAGYRGFMEQVDLMIDLYKGRAERARDAKARPQQPRELPKIVDAQKEAALERDSREPKLRKEKPSKPVQESFGFMEEGKGSYQLPSPDLLDPTPPLTKKVSKEDMLAQSGLLARKLLDFDIEGRVTQV